MLAPLVYKRKNWVYWGVFTAFFSVLGGIFGYIIGFALFNAFGEYIINLYSLQDEMMRLGEAFARYEFLTIFSAALTPIPYKVFTISSGLFKVNFIIFLLASILGRALRSLIVAWLSERFGPLVVKQIRDHVVLSSIGIVVFVLAIILLSGIL